MGPSSGAVAPPAGALSAVLVVHDLANGTVARARALSEALAVLGHRTRTLSLNGDELWHPAQGTAFARTCARVSRRDLSAAVAAADLVVAVKPMPSSLGPALRAAVRHRKPLLVDVDDPDVEARTRWLPRRTLLEDAARHPKHLAELAAAGQLARRLPTTVSNPVLQRLYGGEVVPHASPDRGAGNPHTREQPVMAFIGTAGPHKGIGLLRRAAERLHPAGWRLLVTADPPPDARPWESWLGARTPGTRALLEDSDVIVIASHPPSRAPRAPGDGAGQRDFARGQLPLKLVESMMAARAVAVADYGPLPWAARGAPVFPAGDLEGLLRVLQPWCDPALRARVGADLRAEALARYTPQAVAPALERAIATALTTTPWLPGSGA